MVRRVIEIDRDRCNGCGACANACQEGAIGMVDGKAVLLRDDYCDGLGNCLPHCPTNAITFVEREAAAFDEKAVAAAQLMKKAEALIGSAPVTRSGCSGSMPMQMGGCPGSQTAELAQKGTDAPLTSAAVSRLEQWPIQIKLLPVQAPFYQGARLLIAADCTAFSRGDFHERFMKGRITMIGCPKLDEGDYTEKLTEILRNNEIREVTIGRMDVPCCVGLQRAVAPALRDCGKFLPWLVVTLSRDGRILD